MFEFAPELTALLRDSGSNNTEVALAAQTELFRGEALELPLRKAVLSGNILGNIFETVKLDANVSAEFPLDFIAPGTEDQYVAYTIPNHGYIPERHVEGDYVNVPIYDVGNSIDWNLKYARDARWDIVGRATSVFRDGFVKKLNDDGWQTLLAAGFDRNIIVADSDADQGQFTKRLVSLMKTVMRRNGGGNSTSVNRGSLTDLYVSPEAMEDIRNWNVDQVDDVTRREIMLREDDAVSRLFGVNLHTLDELGEGQEYQLYLTSTLGLTMPTAGGHTDVEAVIGLDLNKRDAFMMPVREELQVFTDPVLHRQRRAGIYGWMSLGFAALSNQRVIVGTF